MRGLHRIACGMAMIVALVGCEKPAPPPPPLSKEAQITRDAPPELMFRGTFAGRPIHLVVNDCEVYSVRSLEGGEVEWTSVLKPEFYPFFTVCQRQHLALKGDVLTAELGRMAIGAGGCCATGGTYRSTDGIAWKRTGY